MVPEQRSSAQFAKVMELLSGIADRSQVLARAGSSMKYRAACDNQERLLHTCDAAAVLPRICPLHGKNGPQLLLDPVSY